MVDHRNDLGPGNRNRYPLRHWLVSLFLQVGLRALNAVEDLDPGRPFIARRSK